MKTADVVERRKKEIESKIGDKNFYFTYKRYLVGFNIEDLNHINQKYGKNKNIEIVDIADMTPSYNCLLSIKGDKDSSFYKLLKVFNIDDVEDSVGIISNLLEYYIIWNMEQSIYTIEEFAEQIIRDDSDEEE